MFASRTATGLTIALLALPAVATADPLPYGAAGSSGNPHFIPKPYDRCYGVNCPTSSLDRQSPDAADAARAGEIAKAMEHYQRSQPLPAAAQPASHDDNTPAWPELAFAGLVLLTTTGGVVAVRLRRRQRVAA